MCLFAKQLATYKGRALLRAPRIDPSGPDSGTRLPPQSSAGKAIAWPRMKDAGFWEKVVGQLANPSPRHAILLAAPPKHTPPQVDDVVAERPQCATVGRHRM